MCSIWRNKSTTQRQKCPKDTEMDKMRHKVGEVGHKMAEWG